jgi:4-hydroxyphenylpyruvate dioxygenase
LGFDLIAYGDNTTGLKDRVSFILKQGHAHVILTSTVNNSDFIQKHVINHGDGVRDICFFVNEIEKTYSNLVNKNVKMVNPLSSFTNEDGVEISKFTVSTFNDTVHTFVSYNNFNPNNFPLLLHYKTSNNKHQNKDYISSIDHIALCGAHGFINECIGFYCNILDFSITRTEDIGSEQSGMRTIVLESLSSVIKLPVVEPLTLSEKSALDEFIYFYNGSGIHHVAFYSKNIINTVNNTRCNGVQYMDNTTKLYYDNLKKRVNTIVKENLEELEKNHILLDLEEDGYLLQIFSKPLQPKPTFFIEIIQRENIDGFGSGNIKALYDSIAVEKSKHIIK